LTTFSKLIYLLIARSADIVKEINHIDQLLLLDYKRLETENIFNYHKKK